MKYDSQASKALVALLALGRVCYASPEPSSTSEALRPTNAASVDDFKFSGCYVDDENNPIMEEQVDIGRASIMTVGRCLQYCRDRGWTAAGIQQQDCWCSDQAKGEKSENESDCDWGCPGYPLEACGGTNGRMSVYVLEGRDDNDQSNGDDNKSDNSTTTTTGTQGSTSATDSVSPTESASTAGESSATESASQTEASSQSEGAEPTEEADSDDAESGAGRYRAFFGLI